MSHDDHVQKIIESHYQRNDPVGWFEALYSSAQGNSDVIPWADEKANPHLVAWLDRERVSGEGRRAIVVGCGLGDDAEELARRGFDVTAFDVSQTAIDWCKRRSPSSRVRYTQADLLNPPREWTNAFDFVFEAYTIQALPRSLRAEATKRVASFVAPRGGQLLVVCRGREEDESEGTLPYPLSHADVAAFESHGLTRLSFENFFDHDRDPPIRRFRALFQRD